MPLGPGDILANRYRLDAPLGSGGFGEVLRATDLRTQRVVAVKVLKVDDDQARARFAREVAIVARLRSPHTVALLDAGVSADGSHYAVFEYIEGQDLSETLAEHGALPGFVVERVLRQLLHSLAEAHRLNLLHRDLKPANIRVFTEGNDPWRVKLLDFGIARATDGGHPNLTATGELVGTPRYMSPEQLTEKPLTPASDIYSLGMVAFEMLAGPDALQGGSWGAQLDRLRTEYSPNFAGFADAGPLGQIVLAMMQKDPSERPASAQAVLNLLDGASQSVANPAGAKTVVDVATSPPHRAGEWLVAIAFLALAVGGGAWFFWPDTSPAPSAPPERPLPAHRANPLGGPTTPADPMLEVPEETEPVETAPKFGCGADAPFLGTGLLKPVELGPDGWYTHIPTSYEPGRAHPLVVLLHDDAQPARYFLENSGFASLADQRGFVVIAPESQSSILNVWEADDEDEVLAHKIEITAELLCIDPRRVFVVGQGSGGQMSFEMLCQDTVRAGAKNTHVIRGSGPEPCAKKPLIMVNSERSVFYPAEGGRNCSGHRRDSASEEERVWREQLGCTGKAKRVYSDEGGSCKSWECEQSLVSCMTTGGGAWPGTVEGRKGSKECKPVKPSSFQTTERVWAFFEGLDDEGCGVDPPFVGKGVLEAGGDSWLTYIPQSAGSAPMPMLMLLHQAEESAQTMFDVSGFAALAEEHGFVVVAPNAYTGWKGDTERLDAIAAETTRQLCIDRTRQFAVGHGQGGSAVGHLSCSPWADAVATNSHRSGRMQHKCDRPIPHITLAGLKTRHEPVDGGENCRGFNKLSLADWEKNWANRNRCEGSPQVSFEYEGSTCYEYRCESPLVSCHLNGGHGWPGSEQRISDKLPGPFNGCDGTPPDFPTAERIWDFFDRLE